MKFGAQDFARFLREPSSRIEAVLCYGPDAGLARERALLLARAAVPDLADPFRSSELSPAALLAEPQRLEDEARQWSLSGGRRVIFVREAGDSLAPLMKRFLEAAEKEKEQKNAGAFIVVEAGELGPRSALRRLFEERPSGAAIACYPDSERDLGALIRETLSAQRIRLSRDAEAYLLGHLGGDRLLTRSELEKLALYAGEGGAIGLEEARAVVGDSALLSLDDAVLAAAEGDGRALERALDRVIAEGASPVGAVRALLRHFLRLHAIAAERASGKPAEGALRAARPPIFYKQMESWKKQLSQWSEKGLRETLQRLNDAELAMKKTGFPAETLLREAFFAVACRARVEKERGSPRE